MNANLDEYASFINVLQIKVNEKAKQNFKGKFNYFFVEKTKEHLRTKIV